MGILEDVMKALDRIPIWKRLSEVPNEVDDLKQRVADLEKTLGDKWPPEICRFCGERKARLRSTLGPDGKHHMKETWVCKSCNGHDIRIIAPTRR